MNKITLIPTSYQTPDRKFTVVAVKFSDNGDPLAWIVYKTGDSSEVINNTGEWEWQPRPSERSKDFINRTRFNDIGDVIRILEKITA